MAYLYADDDQHRPAAEDYGTFRECRTCAAKPGRPLLCSGCLHNRELIHALVKKLRETRAETTAQSASAAQLDAAADALRAHLRAFLKEQADITAQLRMLLGD